MLVSPSPPNPFLTPLYLFLSLPFSLWPLFLLTLVPRFLSFSLLQAFYRFLSARIKFRVHLQTSY